MIATPMISTSATAAWATQMLRNHDPSHWPSTRRNTSPQRGQASAIETHLRKRWPWLQTGQCRSAPRRISTEVDSATASVWQHAPAEARAGGEASRRSAMASAQSSRVPKAGSSA